MNIWHDISEDRIFPTDFISVAEISNLPKHIFDEIRHFFTVYKDLEGKKTAVKEFGGAAEAIEVIQECIDRYKEKYGEALRDTI